VAARVAEARVLSAGITNFRHNKSPVLGYRPMCGENPEATARWSAASKLRAEIVSDSRRAQLQAEVVLFVAGQTPLEL
jgi:hypothetical protein